jgi:hypothetical protein
LVVPGWSANNTQEKKEQTPKSDDDVDTCVRYALESNSNKFAALALDGGAFTGASSSSSSSTAIISTLSSVAVTTESGASAKPIVGLGDLLGKYTTVGASGGVVAFGTTLATSTWAQKLVGLSTGSLRSLPTLAGAVSVCAAACLSRKVALFVDQLSRASHRQRGGRRPVSWDHFVQAWPQDTSRTVVSLDHIRYCKIDWLVTRLSYGKSMSSYSTKATRNGRMPGWPSVMLL